jgi:lipopolysaccharide export system protein LptA
MGELGNNALVTVGDVITFTTNRKRLTATVQDTGRVEVQCTEQTKTDACSLTLGHT